MTWLILLEVRGIHYMVTVMYTLGNKLSRSMTKPTQWPVSLAKTQISLGIRQIWSEPSLSAWRNIGSHWAHSEDSDQTGRMPSLTWVFAGRTGHIVGFVILRLIYFCLNYWFIWIISLTSQLKHMCLRSSSVIIRFNCLTTIENIPTCTLVSSRESIFLFALC